MRELAPGAESRPRRPGPGDACTPSPATHLQHPSAKSSWCLLPRADDKRSQGSVDIFNYKNEALAMERRLGPDPGPVSTRPLIFVCSSPCLTLCQLLSPRVVCKKSAFLVVTSERLPQTIPESNNHGSPQIKELLIHC